jgi:hypothetical protein
VVEVALVDLLGRHKAVDLDGMAALELDRIEFVRLDLDMFASGKLVAARLLVGLDHLAGLGVDHLLLRAVASLLVDQVEAGLSRPRSSSARARRGNSPART